MRPEIVKFLNEYFHTTIFKWLVPELAIVYVAAIICCLWVFIKRIKKAGYSEYHAWGAAICGIIAGLIGVRVWYLLMNVDRVIDHPNMLFDLNGATVSFGGYFFGLVAFIIYLFVKKQNPLVYLDIIASCLGLGQMIGRWSCFLNGDDYGTITSVPWAVRYPPGSYPFVDQVNKGIINVTADYSLPVHPVQIYLSIKGLILFIVCTYIWRKYKFKPGILFGIYWLLYAVLRFTFEFYRGDNTANFWNSFTYGQCMCIIIFAVSMVYIRILKRKKDWSFKPA